MLRKLGTATRFTTLSSFSIAVSIVHWLQRSSSQDTGVHLWSLCLPIQCHRQRLWCKDVKGPFHFRSQEVGTHGLRSLNFGTKNMFDQVFWTSDKARSDIMWRSILKYPVPGLGPGISFLMALVKASSSVIIRAARLSWDKPQPLGLTKAQTSHAQQAVPSRKWASWSSMEASQGLTPRLTSE